MLIRNVLAPLLLPHISLAKLRYIGAFDIYPLIQHKAQIIRYTIQKNVNNKEVFLIKQIPCVSSITKQIKVTMQIRLCTLTTEVFVVTILVINLINFCFDWTRLRIYFDVFWFLINIFLFVFVWKTIKVKDKSKPKWLLFSPGFESVFNFWCRTLFSSTFESESSTECFSFLKNFGLCADHKDGRRYFFKRILFTWITKFGIMKIKKVVRTFYSPLALIVAYNVSRFQSPKLLSG